MPVTETPTSTLNRRHAPNGPPKFFLFHRRRVWNPTEKRWMGWERKRGKLSEFNRLLLGAKDTTYAVTSADPADLHVWRELSLRLATRPTVWTLRAAAADETLDLNYEDKTGRWSRRFAFAELRDPRTLLAELAGPLPLAGVLGPLAALEPPQTFSPQLDWEARNDWLEIGHAQVRVYRLRAQLLDRYQIVVIVSRVGEIMRVELPDGL